GTGTAQTQPTATATLGSPPVNAGVIQDIVVDAGGTGYTAAPTVIFSSGSAAATATLATIGAAVYKVGSITVDAQGYGYTADPIISFSGGGGVGVLVPSTATPAFRRGCHLGK